jgi:CO/xanthine dehydrogenase Mo-binding subunit
MLHGKVLRSPHAHALIRDIRIDKALAIPGVRAVVTARDFPDIPLQMVASGEAGMVNLKEVAEYCMASKKVLFEGHAVAAVAADSPHIADEALAAIEVDYEVLKPVLSVDDALAEDAPVLHDTFIPGAFLMPTEQVSPNAGQLTLALGNIEEGFAKADIVVEREFRTDTVHQGYIEPHVTTVFWDENDHVTVWTSTQGAFAIRDLMSGVLRMPQSKIKVIPLEIGGGFGGKDMIFLDPVAAFLSKKTRRHVKMAMSRAEILRATGPSPASHMKVKMGVSNDGKIVAAKLYIAFEAGAFPGGPIAPASICAITRYTIPHVLVEGLDVATNKPRSRPYRAPGSTQSHFAVETVIDELAEKLKLDPIEFRLRNVANPGDPMILGLPMMPTGAREILEAVKDHPHYKAPLPGKNCGRGVSFAFWFGAGLTSSAEIRVNTDGSVLIAEGSADLSGTRMTLAMQAAEVFGIPVDDITVTVPDTDSVGYTFQSVGSRTTFATGIAVYEAAQMVIEKMKARAAMMWNASQEVVDFKDGLFRHQEKADLRLSFKEIAEKMLETGGFIHGQATVDPEITRVGPQTAAAIVDVAVDPETGKVDVRRMTIFQDVGKAIHPDYVAGQMQGGAVQGIGWALYEGYFYDKEGHLRNASLLDYRMPTALDLPMIDTVIIEVPNPGHPFGVRGVGEVPIVPPAAAIANAIYDAVGIRMHQLPMTPDRILEAIWQKEGGQS